MWTAFVTSKKPCSAVIVFHSATTPRSRSNGTSERRISATPPPYAVALTCSTRTPSGGAARRRSSSTGASPAHER
ncbi:hypothetical protein [Streptomyces sp. NPDC058755]|uniref:hypothetical protein n=1 Tax=Streptomyces sp. NPDC058755 TaxID=3346624 RepID=UPI0036A65F33